MQPQHCKSCHHIPKRQSKETPSKPSDVPEGSCPRKSTGSPLGRCMRRRGRHTLLGTKAAAVADSPGLCNRASFAWDARAAIHAAIMQVLVRFECSVIVPLERSGIKAQAAHALSKNLDTRTPPPSAGTGSHKPSRLAVRGAQQSPHALGFRKTPEHAHVPHAMPAAQTPCHRNFW
jgi:hypothetical protein